MYKLGTRVHHFKTMKHTAFITTGLLIFATTLFPHPAHATVGGPTFVERLSFNQKDNSIYYVLNNQSGRGCPPEIMKIDTASGERTTIASCDFIEKKYSQNGGLDFSAYNTFVETVFSETIPLEKINLEKNNVSAQITYTGPITQSEENISSGFEINVAQENSPKETLNFIGCHKNQPAVLTGYAIPKTNKIALVLSRIGDCFEGGYTKDDVYLLSNIAIIDGSPTQYRNVYSGPRVQEGDVVVYPNKLPLVQPAAKTENTLTQLVIPLIISFIFGAVFGFFIRKPRN